MTVQNYEQTIFKHKYLKKGLKVLLFLQECYLVTLYSTYFCTPAAYWR